MLCSKDGSLNINANIGSNSRCFIIVVLKNPCEKSIEAVKSETQILKTAESEYVHLVLLLSFFCNYCAAAFNDRVRHRRGKTGQNSVTQTSLTAEDFFRVN